jgi:hypothetical protein
MQLGGRMVGRLFCIFLSKEFSVGKRGKRILRTLGKSVGGMENQDKKNTQLTEKNQG